MRRTVCRSAVRVRLQADFERPAKPDTTVPSRTVADRRRGGLGRCDLYRISR